MRRVRWSLIILVYVCQVSSSRCTAEPAGESPPDSLAAKIRTATQAIEADPKDPLAYQRRAALYVAAQDHRAAIADYDALVKLDPTLAAAYDERGSQHFMLGHITESIDDFDRFIKLRPEQEPWHWKRGISYYYAGRFDEGRRQFEGYQKVDDNDVENAVWRYLCMARGLGVAKARAAILKIRRDPRVPMMEVYALYSGQGQEADVLAAAASGSPSPEALNSRMFYANLYLGLYHDAAGDIAQAQQYLTHRRAAQDRPLHVERRRGTPGAIGVDC